MHHSTARRLLAVLALIATQATAEADRFQQMAQETTKALKADEKLRGFDTEILVARPFVILMTRDPDGDPKTLEERKHRLGTLAQGVWRNWLKVRADWQLRSTRNDTLEQPEPFVWISFHDEAAYGRFMKEFRPKSTSGSRAYYSTETHSVYIRPLVGPNNRDVQKNMQKAVQCLDQRIAILRQTPEIQAMHRQWADWMRTTFPKLPNAPTKHPLTDLSDDRNAAIDRVIIKGAEPEIIYIPIIHDDQFSHISSTDLGGVRDIMTEL